MKMIRHRKFSTNYDCLSFFIDGVGSVRIATHGRTMIHISGDFPSNDDETLDQIGCEMTAEEFLAVMGEVVRARLKQNPDSEI